MSVSKKIILALPILAIGLAAAPATSRADNLVAYGCQGTHNGTYVEYVKPAFIVTSSGRSGSQRSGYQNYKFGFWSYRSDVRGGFYIDSQGNKTQRRVQYARRRVSFNSFERCIDSVPKFMLGSGGYAAVEFDKDGRMRNLNYEQASTYTVSNYSGVISPAPVDPDRVYFTERWNQEILILQSASRTQELAEQKAQAAANAAKEEIRGEIGSLKEFLNAAITTLGQTVADKEEQQAHRDELISANEKIATLEQTVKDLGDKNADLLLMIEELQDAVGIAGAGE